MSAREIFKRRQVGKTETKGSKTMTQLDALTDNKGLGSSRSDARMLKNKCAVVFGAGGSIGAAVAMEFAAEGARVFLAGRTKASLEAVAERITSAGGETQTTVVDALDDAAVNRYLDDVAKRTGKIDVVVDLTGPLANEYGNGKVAVELPVDEFMAPLTTIVKSHFITARAAARHMINQRSGVIIFVTGSPARPHVPGATAIGAAFGAIENLTGNLAFEVSPLGVRVVCLRTVANVDSRPIQDTMEFVSRRMNITKEQAIGQVALSNFLKVPATVQDTANAAVLIASDRARMLTGTVVNASAGAALD
jgi:NAD(P)-dependent dehydrogenase (short-subunit alcohol dehydrogenase family)